VLSAEEIKALTQWAIEEKNETLRIFRGLAA
jgi:hypothetical protein